MSISLKVTDNLLSYPLIHDAEIIGVTFESRDAQTVTVHFEPVSGQKFQLYFQDGIDVYCGNMHLQNVVFNVSQFEGSLPVELEVDIKAGFELGDSSFEELKKRIANDSLFVTHIFPSVGCEIFIVSKKFRTD